MTDNHPARYSLVHQHGELTKENAKLAARNAELEQMVAVLMRHEARDDTIKVQRARIAALKAALKKLDAAFALMLLDCVDEDYIENFPNEYAEYISAAKETRASMEEKDD